MEHVEEPQMITTPTRCEQHDIYSFGKVENLLHKPLKELECVVFARVRRQAVFKQVGTARKACVACICLSPAEMDGMRAVAVVFDGARFGDSLPDSACAIISALSIVVIRPLNRCTET